MTPLIVNPFFYIVLACALLFCASVIFALFSWASSAYSKGVKAVKLIACSLISIALIAGSFSFLNGIFYFDRSAAENENGFVWHGKQYVPQSGVYDIEKGVAKTKEGHLLSTIEQDKSKSFIVLQSSYGSHLYVKEGVSVPESGKLTGVYIQGKYKSSTALISTVERVLMDYTADYRLKCNNLWEHTNGREMRKISPCFENCPIGTRTDDYIGTLDGEWVYARRVPHYETADAAVFEYDIYRIPESVSNDLEKLF